MPVWERYSISACLVIAAPLSLMVAGWWGAASLSLSRIVPLTDAQIATAAVGGMLAGLLLAALSLRRWLAFFYSIPLPAAALLYVAWAAIATAWFMGLPVGNLALGALAGAYAGRRSFHQGFDQAGSGRFSWSVATFVTAVTAAATFAIGLLAMREPYQLAFVRDALGLSSRMPSQTADLLVVVAAVLVVGLTQSGAAMAAARIAFRLRGPAGAAGAA